MAKDPVCGMEVDEATAEWKSEHMGKTYYFCAPGCMRAFDDYPMKFINSDDTTGHEHHEHHGHH